MSATSSNRKTRTTPVVQTFYRDNPEGGDRLERAVYSEADAVQARFDGYFPDGAAAKDKVATTNKPSTSSGSSNS
jgi:hypothetical protein